MPDRFYEKPAVHQTWTDHENGAVFEYSTYPEGSVLAGQEKRSCLGTYATLAAAKIDWPDAVDAGGSLFVDRPIPIQPYPGFSEDDIGESWLGPDD